MEAAALLLLISGVGVGFGWQPMPDGSQRYEYTVQIEPELAATLAEGKSIPIVADIPPEVQPVGRIRVVVGREELPRQRLVTHLKPATDGAGSSREGVVLTQFTQPPAYLRYGAPPAANAYPTGQAPAAAPQPETTWNGQPDPAVTPTEASPPSGQQLFGQPATGGATTWNNGTAVPAVADATADAIKRAGEEMQRAAAPVVDPLKQSFEQVDSQVRGAVGTLGDRTKSLVDELRQPFNPQPQLPPSSNVPNPLRSNVADTGTSWNQGDAAAGQAVPPPSTPPFASTPPAATPPAGGTQWNNPPTSVATSAPPTGVAPQPQGVAAADPWAGVPDPRTQLQSQQSGNLVSVPELADRPMPFGGIGGNPTGPGPSFPTIGTESGTASTPQPGTTAPSLAAIGSDMLRQPADRPLEEAPPNQPAAPTASVVTQPGGHTIPRATTPVTPAAKPSTPQSVAIPTTAAATGDNAAAVLFAWVLLTGSIAGNMYLFWSYLDVRQKYRSLVRKTARAVGSRFSAA